MRAESIESQGHARAVEPRGAGGPGAAGRLRLPHDATGFRALSRTGRRPVLWLLLPLAALLSLPPAVAQAQTPSISISDGSVMEGAAGTTTELELEVTLNRASESQVEVWWTTYATYAEGFGLAKPGVDYTRDGGTLRFAPGETSKTISIEVFGDDLDEGEYEKIIVELSFPVGAWIADREAEGRILDDDDTPKVTLVLNRDTISENGGEARVRARLNHPSKEETVVTVSFSGWEDDYTLSTNRTLRIAANETTSPGPVYVSLTAVDNDWRVSGKKVTVSGTATNDLAIEDPDDVTLTINDDGDPTLPVMFVRDARVTEGDSGETDMNFRVELTPRLTLPVTFDVRTEEIKGLEGSAKPDHDYRTVNKSVTIEPGETVATISVPIIGDTVHEREIEGFRFWGSAGSDAPARFRDNKGLGTIVDNDRPTVTLALSEDRIREDGGVTTVTASLDRPSVKNTFVRISASAVSPAVKGDFTFGGNRGLTIAAGELSSTRTVTLTAVDNAVDVPFDKTVTVTGNARNERGIDHPEALTLTIVDDEIPVVTIAAETEEVIEERGAVTFIATRTEYDLSRSLTVNFLSNGGPSLPSGTITFAANETTARLGGSPWGDIDADGTVTITLQDGDGYELGAPSSASVTVRDITPVVTIAAETEEVVEEQGAVAFIVTRTELNLAESLTVNFLSNGGASLPSGTVTFAPNETTKRLGGSPWGDIDFDRTVRITLQDGDGYRLGRPSSASVAVRDEDVPVVTVAAETEYVYENGDPVAFIFTRTTDEDLSRSLTVNYRVTHIGGSSNSYALTFAANESSVRIGGAPAGNVDADGTVEITLRDGAGYRPGTPSSAVVTVWDSLPTVSVADADAVTEGETVTFTLRRSGNLAQPLEAAYEITAAGDFGAATGAGAATFPANGAAVQVSVATTDDSVHEANGSVTLALTAKAGVYKLRAGAASTAAVLDDDDSPATGTVTIRGAAREGGTLRANISGVEDADGLDNAAWAYQWVRTPPGGSAADISGATGATYVPVFADVGAALKVRVTVTDNEGHEAGFESAPTPAVAALPVMTVAAETEQVVEGGEPVAFIVTRTGDLSRRLTVNVQVTPVGGDTPTTLAVTFQANQSTRRLGSGNPAGDIDGDGTSVLVLLDGDGYRLGTPSSATVTVWDSDFVPTVSVADADAVTEGGTVTFTLTRSGNRVRTFTAAYETTSSGDFGAATGAGTATFPANSTAVQVSVATTDDSVHEAHGSVTLTLAEDADAYELGSQAASTAAVLDDDDSPATGAVAITGAAREGETLTADTSGVEDADGLDNAAWAYQWVRTPPGGSGADISGATGATYVPVFADAGAALKVRVTVTDDEGHEATLTSAPTPAVAALPLVTVAAETEQVIENGEAVAFIFTRTGDLSRSLTVNYRVRHIGGTSSSGALTFPANESTLRLGGSPAGNVNADGTVAMTLLDGDGYRPGTPSSAVVTVWDSDFVPTVSVADADAVTEGGTVTFTLTRSGNRVRTFAAAYEVTSSGDFGAATGAGTATFPANSAAVQVSVATTDDSVHEAHGSVTLTLAEDADAYELGSQAASTAAVLDDDDSPATGTVTIAGAAREGETLAADISGVEDADGLDNAAWTYQWVRTPSGGSGADIAGATGATYVPVFADAGATFKVRVTVTDDEGHEAGFESAATAAVEALPRPEVTVASGGAVTEGEAVTFTLTRTGGHGGTTGTLDVAYMVTASGDFGAAAGAGTATIPANSAAVQVSVATTGDGAHEQHGSVTLTLAPNPEAYNLGAEAAATAAVLDDDNAAPTGAVTIDDTAPVVGKTLRADASGVDDPDGLTGRSFTWQWLRVSGGTATAIAGATAARYTMVAADVGSALKVRAGFTDDDGTAETVESAPTSAVRAYTFEVTAPTVTEGGDGVTILQFAVTRSDTARRMQLGWRLAASSTAQAGKGRGRDIGGPTQGTLNFPRGWTVSRFVVFQVIDDWIDESDETVVIEFFAVAGTPAGVTFPPTVTGTIRDNDTSMVWIAPSRSVDEGDEGVRDLAFTVSMDNPSDREVTVAWDVSGTAEAGSDYTAPAPALVTFPALSWDSQRIVFGVIGDTDAERHETVTVALRDPTGGAVLGTSQATAQIRNDEELVLAVDPPEAVEGDSRSDRAGLIFRLTLTDLADTDVTVDYRVESDAGTATAGSDFKDKSGTATIKSGQTVATVRLGILEDTDFEPDETVVMVFENPEGALLDPGSTRVTGTILNDDPPDGDPTNDNGPVVSIEPPEVAEGDSRSDRRHLTFRLTLSDQADSDITVDYRVDAGDGAGTAAAGSDFKNKSGTVTIRSGRTSAVVRLGILEDTDFEPDETVVMVFENPQGAVLDPGSTRVTGTILNDDLSQVTVADAVVAIAAESGVVTEGEDAVFVLTRTGEASAPLTVAVAVGEAGSVLAGAAPSAAVFGANETEARLRVATEDDVVDEADGRVTAAAVAGAGYTVAAGAGSAAVDVLDNDDPAAPGEPAPLWSTTMTVVDFGKAVGASGSDLPNRAWSEDGVDYRLDRLKWFGPPKGLVRVRFSRRLPAVDELTLRAGALSLPLAEGGSGRVFRWPVEGAPWPVGEEVELRLTRTAAGEGDDGAAVPGVSVADARVDESAGAPLAFRVTLDEAQMSAVSVRYATSDGSATAGADYVAASGVVRFEAGETVKTVNVAVLEDSHDEGEETMTLTLSHPFGAEVSDGVATGTIVNTDAMPRAWLGRFGRTVAGQVVEAVEARMTAVRQAGVEVSIAGQRVGAAGAFDEAASRGGDAVGGRLAGGRAGENGPEGLDMAASRDAGAAGGRLAGWLAGGIDSEERTVSGRELLAGMSFARTEGTAESGFVSLWGRGVVTDFDGRDGELSVDGEVATGLLGADWARGDWAAGLMVGHSRGEGNYGGQGVGTVSSSLTGLYPWGRWELNERVTVWGVGGYGAGTLTLEPEGQARIETDMDLAMAAAGLRGVLMEAPAEGGFELAAKTDGLIVRSASEAARGGDGGMLEAARAEVTRLRLGLEGTRAFRSEGGWTLTPSFGLGVRHDGGDAESGVGVEVGAGVAYADPSLGLTAEFRGRGLLGHEAAGFREVGFSGSLAFDPSPSSDRGLSLSLSQTLGASASGGVEALYGRDTMAGLGGANDAAGTADDLGRRRLEARVGYGVSAFGGRFTGTPELGFGLSESGRDYRLGWRLTPAGDNAGWFELSLVATRREAANDDGSEHGAELRVTIR